MLDIGNVLQLLFFILSPTEGGGGLTDSVLSQLKSISSLEFGFQVETAQCVLCSQVLQS